MGTEVHKMSDIKRMVPKRNGKIKWEYLVSGLSQAGKLSSASSTHSEIAIAMCVIMPPAPRKILW